MGGPMSVNDDLPWIQTTLQLIRAADTAGVPVIGHCLGGQLMARAFGGTVTGNPVKEIGWGTVEATPDASKAWMPYVRYAVGGVLFFLIFFMVVRPLMVMLVQSAPAAGGAVRCALSCSAGRSPSIAQRNS